VSVYISAVERSSRDTEDAIIEHPNLRGPGYSMLTHPTLDLLHSLGLHGIAKGFKDLDTQSEARSLEHAEWLALLLEHEKTLRQQKRFESRARAAKLLASRMSITALSAASTARSF
jgi:hypothetical protein